MCKFFRQYIECGGLGGLGHEPRHIKVRTEEVALIEGVDWLPVFVFHRRCVVVALVVAFALCCLSEQKCRHFRATNQLYSAIRTALLSLRKDRALSCCVADVTSIVLTPARPT